jgi:hypothetical protein
LVADGQSGSFYSSYQIGSFRWKCSNGAEPRKESINIWFRLRISILTAVEVMDGYSSDWGASTGDIIANASGTALCVSGAVVE